MLAALENVNDLSAGLVEGRFPTLAICTVHVCKGCGW